MNLIQQLITYKLPKCLLIDIYCTMCQCLSSGHVVEITQDKYQSPVEIFATLLNKKYVQIDPTKISSLNVFHISFLYIDVLSDVSNLIQTCIFYLVNDGIIFIPNFNVDKNFMEFCRTNNLQVNQLDGNTVVTFIHDSHMYETDISMLLAECKDGIDYYSVGGGVGDVLASLSMIKNSNMQNVNIFSCNPMCADFIQEQPYAHKVVNTSVAKLNQYINKPNITGSPTYKIRKYIYGHLNNLIGTKSIKMDFDVGTLYEENIGFSKLSKFEIPANSKKIAYNISAVLDKSNTFMVLPYSATSPPERAWTDWHKLMEWLFTNGKDSIFLLCGIHWDASIYEDYPNVINLVDKLPSVSCLFALAQYCKFIFTTVNCMASWSVANGERAFMFCNSRLETTKGGEMWLSILKSPTTELISYNTKLDDFIKDNNVGRIINGQNGLL